MQVKKALGVAGVAAVVVTGVVCGGLYFSQDSVTGKPVSLEEDRRDAFTEEPVPDTLQAEETKPSNEEVKEDEAHETNTLTAGAIDRAVTVGG